MEIVFTPKAQNDIKDWRRSGNIGVQKKIDELIESIQENPFEGIGKPEQLRFDLSGKWSRRIDREHRIVYDLKNEVLTIYSLKGHYD